MWHICATGFQPTAKNNELLSNKTTWMSLTKINAEKKRLYTEYGLYDFTYMKFKNSQH